MSPGFRAVLGAAMGALVTLCLHPTSRPFMLGGSTHVVPADLRECIDSNSLTLLPPRNLPEASLWMQLAAQRIARREKLSSKERITVLGIAKEAEAREKTNAFWPQMEAILLADSDRMPEAIEAWGRASACPGWDDYQLVRLFQARSRIAEVVGGEQSWELAYLYYARSYDFSVCLRIVARAILSKADYRSPDGLTKRFETLLNSEVVRRHARTSRLSITAMDILDLATYPSNSVSSTPKRLLGARAEVLRGLSEVLHRPDWADTARQIMKTADAWRALTVHDSNEEQSEVLAFGTVLCSSVANAAVLLSGIGLVIWSLGKLVASRMAQDRDIKTAVAMTIAIVLAGLVELLTRYWPAAVAAALCAAFLTVAPSQTRNARPSDLGPLFSFMAVLLGSMCSVMFMMYLIGLTPAANSILPSLGVPSDYFDRPLMAGISAVCFGLVLLIAPIWAVVHRLGTPHVLSLALTRFGGFIATMGLILSIVLGPTCVYADRRLESMFTELVKNEPVHYYMNP